MRPLFCGNLDYDVRQSELERLFRKYGKVERIDMKSGEDLFVSLAHKMFYYAYLSMLSFTIRQYFNHQQHQEDAMTIGLTAQLQIRNAPHNRKITDESLVTPITEVYYPPLVSYHHDFVGFAFVYMEDERDAEDAIRRLDRIEFGRKGRRLRVEWTKQERESRRAGDGGGKRSSGNTKPSKTLFVINFDPINTRSRDLERHFEPYGKIANVRVRRNFAFIQYESEDDATKALEATNMSKLMDRVISVEYSIRDDDDRRNGYSPDRRGGRGGGASPNRGYDRRRSPSPYRRERGSPDYGYRRERDSPDYGHGPNSNSKSERKASPAYARDASPASGRSYSRSPPPPRERSREKERENPQSFEIHLLRFTED
ncbi:hypothetical protein V2J09_001569 [Rumex salicifolius]